MKVAIVGAGISGLSSAYLLFEQDPELEITIFEKSKALGGRMATRRTVNNVPVDTGCQFLSFDHDEIHEFFLHISPADTFLELPQSILCLPDGFVVDRKGRYFVKDGMTQWSKALVRELENRNLKFKIEFEKTIQSYDSLIQAGYDRILISCPGPQGLALGAKNSVEYHPCLTLIFSWHKPPREALAHFAYRDVSSREGISWLSHEGVKRGHPEIWLAQVSAQASREWHNRNLSPDQIEDIIQDDLTAWIPLFEEGEKTLLDQKFWLDAFPIQFGGDIDSPAFERLNLEGGKRVYFIGDGYRGVGRAENAIESAFEVSRDFVKP